jgi:hypothetical protein
VLGIAAPPSERVMTSDRILFANIKLQRHVRSKECIAEKVGLKANKGTFLHENQVKRFCHMVRHRNSLYPTLRKYGIQSERHYSIVNTNPSSHTKGRHVFANNQFVGITIVQILQTPLLGFCRNIGTHDTKYLISVGMMIVETQLLVQTFPVLTHWSQVNVFCRENTFGTVIEDEILCHLGTSASKEVVATWSTLRRRVRINGNAIYTSRVQENMSDASHLNGIVQIILLYIGAVSVIIESITIS